MEGVACPQCGNPNLDVDAQNNVVYCKKCGFAVQVDPATGNVTPISEGGAGAQPPAEYAGAPSGKTILGTDPLTFYLICFALLALVFFIGAIEIDTLGVLVILLTIYYFYAR